MKPVLEQKNAVPGAGTSKNGRSSLEPTNTPLLSGVGKDLSSMENTGYCFFSEVEEIQFQMSCGIDAISCIHELMAGAGGIATVDGYTGALYCAYDYLRMLNDQLKEVVDKAKEKNGASR